MKTIVGWPEPARTKAVIASTEWLLHEMAKPCTAQCIWTLRELVWPGLPIDHITDAWREKLTLSLEPLKRIGQMEGKSGSLVLVGRLQHEEEPRPSQLLIIKSMSAAESKLTTEWENAQNVKPFTYDRKDSFAIPLRLDQGRADYDLLWTLCMPTVREGEGPLPDLDVFPRVDDLRTVLGAYDNHDRAETLLKATYTVLKNLHRSLAFANPALRRRPVKLGDEYKWYLRGYSASGSELWGPEWINVWAAPKERKLSTGSANPLWVVEQLKSQRSALTYGTIHGDLHAGNIILRGDIDPPAIIDFGWSQREAHIAKDFVLMECNIRFLTLAPYIKDSDLKTFCGWVSEHQAKPTLTERYLQTRMILVEALRGYAHDALGPGINWDLEYLAPLFFVGFGLLRFAKQLGNQRAALLFIEALADHLATTLKLV